MYETIDSEYIEIEISREISCVYGIIKRNRIDFTIYEDGEIMFDFDKDVNRFLITTNEMLEIGRISKLYKTKRIIYLKKEEKNDSISKT